VTVFQPQLDQWDGFHLAARVAVAVKDGAQAPVYGILQVAAQTIVDKETRLVTLEHFTVTHATFPASADKARQWTTLIQERAKRVQTIALDRLEAAKAVTSAEHEADAVPLKNDPPTIFVSDVPSMLIPVDGDPVYRAVSGTALNRVINTRPLILRDTGGHLFLKLFDGWMEAAQLAGPWTVASKVPPDCDRALQAAMKAKAVDLLVGGDPNDASSRPSLTKGPVPRLYVETQPAELLVTEGPPKYVPVTGTGLLYAENTTGNLFVDTKDQRAYVLVSGRWFAGPASLQGGWRFVSGDTLPTDFANIPDDSPKENVKASVPGTPQAQEAIVANSIPQTARVKRSDATFAPTFDGEPKIEPIDGTPLRYVANSSSPIIVVGSNTEYFGVQNGVWFVSNAVAGPWLVATSVPASVYAIAPSSPLHYVTYVRVYDYTPDYVIVGYTPGYYGAYVNGGCVVYGTGYAYPPWVGTYWYGPPVTYGFGVGLAYTPWSGWHVAFGLGWSWGVSTVAVGWGWGPYPWWGPAGWGWGAAYPWVYRPGYGVAWGPRGGAAVWGPGYWSGTTGNVYHRWGSTAAVTRSAGGYDAWTGNRWAGQGGMAYNSRTGTLAAGQRAGVGNVYTGNYAAGERGAAVNARTGTRAAGSAVTAGNAYTGREVTAGRGVVQGPGGNATSVAGIRGNEGGVVRAGDDVYAGHDGNVYRRQDGGGWQKHTDGGWESSNLGASHDLNRDAAARSAGENRWGNYHSGAFRSGGGRTGGGRRR
jgi:hypothetical protein